LEIFLNGKSCLRPKPERHKMKKMKKIFVSVGLAAAGVAGVTSLHAQSMDAGAAPKIWNVAANLRGFYDDNYAVAHDKTGSFGFELTPSVSANVALQQTDIGVRYTFGMYYYLQRAQNGLDPLDYTHQGDIWLDHSFNERFKLTVADSVAVGQDPQLVQGGAPIRVNGNNVNNTATVTLNSEWTRQFSTTTHYGNNFIDYTGGESTNNISGSDPSDADLLNRIRQDVGTTFNWQFQPETTGFIGYDFTWVDYTGNAQIAPQFTEPSGKKVNYYSDSRNYRTHTGYVGVSEVFSPNLSASVSLGASYTESYNDPVSKQNSLTPYVNASITYTYMPGCYVQAGFTQDQNSTDVAMPGANGQLTQYQESSTFSMSLNHQLTPKLSGAVVGSYQYSSYNDGAYANNTGDSSVDAGLHFNYTINRHFSANAGYNFTELFSTINQRANNRNMVYLGLGANY
jgi:hypothetical protein